MATDRVVACYFTGQVDDQRGTKWEPDPTQLDALIDSVPPGKLIVLHDCFTELRCADMRFAPASISPYIYRWWALNFYLADQDIRYCWHVDATDVRMLREPFDHMKPDTLYCGYDSGTVGGNSWIGQHSESVSEWVRANADLPLLNVGVSGGETAVLRGVASSITQAWATHGGDPLQEMIWFNIAARQMPNLVTDGVTTPFKSYTDDGVAWFAHK